MKPWELLYRFYVLGKSKHFSLEEQAMYSHLVWLAWESGQWSGLQVTNNRMKDFIGKKDDRAIEKPRNRLVQFGLISFTRGKKGSPTKYSLLPQEGKYSVKKEGGTKYTVKNTAQEGGHEGEKTPGIISKGKGIKKEQKGPAPAGTGFGSLLTGEELALSKQREEDIQTLFDFFGRCDAGLPSSYDRGKIEALLNEGYLKAEIYEAIRQGAENKAVKWPYIVKVLENKGREKKPLKQGGKQAGPGAGGGGGPVRAAGDREPKAPWEGLEMVEL